MDDTYKHKGQRKKLVEGIARKGITDTRVLDAINAVPRHLFVESYLENRAYDDNALPIAAGQTISQPYTVAYQTQLLRVGPGHSVLEIGTGSGYQAAVLLEMGAKVYTLERQRGLFASTGELLKKLNYRPQTFYGDGYKGLPAHQPFDRIIVTAGAPDIPQDLKMQLKPGGRMVVPVGSFSHQVMVLVERKNYQDFQETAYDGFVFVPMRPGTE